MIKFSPNDSTREGWTSWVLHLDQNYLYVNHGLYSPGRHHLIKIGISIINLRRASDRVRCTMKIPIHMRRWLFYWIHYSDVTTGTVASQITSLTIVYSTICSHADQRKHQSAVSLAFVRGIHRWPVNSSHKGPGTRKIFPWDDVLMFKLLAGSVLTK